MEKIKDLVKLFIINAFKWIKQLEAAHEDLKNDLKGCIVIGDKEKIKVGKSVSFGGRIILFANHEIEIGDHTMIGINTVFHTSTHNYCLHPMWLSRIDRPIKVGVHVWIGTNVLITPGVIIDDYAVIGAGSVVVDNVPKGAIVAGNPARIIKFRSMDKIDWDKNRRLEYPDNSFMEKKGFKTTFCKNKTAID